MSLPTASCEAESNFSALSIIIRKQTSIDHAKGIPNIFLFSPQKKIKQNRCHMKRTSKSLEPKKCIESTV